MSKAATWRSNSLGGGREDRMPALAADLVRRRVAVIASPGSTAGMFAAKAAASSIPIVFVTGDDPVALGLVASLNRPGGNVTGVEFPKHGTTAKRFGLLRELTPKAARFLAFASPNAAMTDAIVKDVHAQRSNPRGSSRYPLRRYTIATSRRRLQISSKSPVPHC